MNVEVGGSSYNVHNTAYETVEVDVVLILVITCTTQHYTVEADV